ncbi:hypothetical protein [Streptomyces sp. NPDC058572]|uniref:hypothetical protein n=1 Tax=Streptomyces sp. NPDC058572 TaxID=3346546 RepID=UPI00366A1131
MVTKWRALLAMFAQMEWIYMLEARRQAVPRAADRPPGEAERHHPRRGRPADQGRRTRSAFRSACATFPASHAVSFSASRTEHTRKPRCSRIWERWYSIVLPVHW